VLMTSVLKRLRQLFVLQLFFTNLKADKWTCGQQSVGRPWPPMIYSVKGLFIILPIFPPSSPVVCFFPVGLSSLIHFQQVLCVLKFLLSPDLDS